MTRPRLRHLRVSGAGKPDASVEFGDGLTYITGWSDTGKSHILACVDYALGASQLPKAIPEAQGYDLYAIEIELGDRTFTLGRRAGDPINATLYTGPLAEWDRAEGEELKIKKPKKGDGLDSLSGWLLRASGFDPTARLISSQQGKSQGLSFRNVSPFVVIDETEVISATSPVLPQSEVRRTAAQSVFQILLTGTSPTPDEILVVQSAHRKKEEAKQRVEILKGIIEDTRETLKATNVDRGELERRLEQIDAELASVSETVSASGDKLNAMLRERNTAARRADDARSAAARADELEERFGLLKAHYQADIERLEFVLEGGHFFRQIAASHCPTCGRPAPTDGKACHPEAGEPEAIESAAAAEIRKLRPRIADLDKAREDAVASRTESELAQKRGERRAAELNEEIRAIAEPSAQAARKRVKQVTDQRRALEEHLLRFRELDRYERALQDADLAARRSVPRFKPEQEAARLRDLCTHVDGLLHSWKYPLQNTVRFSPDTDDLVIDGKERGAYGKGIRAVVRAAFNIALMNYCAERGTPHPGFVILDSPLLSFKGIKEDEEDPQLTSDLHAAFLHNLASAGLQGQAIVIENVEPPASLEAEGAKVHQFGESHPRKGFYPGDTQRQK